MNSEDLQDHGVIETSTGHFFNPKDPVFYIEDIAHGLSNKCRFNGQCSYFYSVAEHSVLVSKLAYILGGDPREGLLHDGAEAYLPDVPSPFKQLLPDLRAMEDRVEAALRAHYCLPPAKTPAVARADLFAVLIEAEGLLPSRGQGPNWNRLAAFRDEALSYGIQPRYLPPALAKVEFLAQYKELS